MTGPVEDFELGKLRAEPYARGWRIARDGERVTAERADGSAFVNTASVREMHVVLHNAMWETFTGCSPHLRDER